MNLAQIGQAPLRLECSQVIYYNPQQWDWESVIPNYLNLWIALTGRGWLRLNQETFQLEPGFAVLLFPGDQVSARGTGSGPIQNVGMHLLTPPSIVGDFHFTRMRGKPTRLRNVAAVREIARYMEYLCGLRPGVDPRELDQWARQLFLIFCRDWELGPEDPLDQIIRKQVEAVKEDPKRDWSLADLAAETMLSHSQYGRRFARLIGISPRAFIIQRRIETACLLLREGTMTIDQIADSLGYRDVAFFSRQFKEKMGSSPSTYRRAQPAGERNGEV